MDTHTQIPQRVFIDLVEDLTAQSPMDAQNDADVARSERNIRRWMAYLPADCIKTMMPARPAGRDRGLIARGWPGSSTASSRRDSQRRGGVALQGDQVVERGDVDSTRRCGSGS
jgi:hypothetical protein